ncbi:SMP-30/gluconolactonase/LRE family protein [Pseudorhodoplanes sp.]|uniref:SMP-30/gluconolactonase/LRE family protein n=1 Tax=Pseudorhodoplanes sp. TaxID=1934341 RepID=UPI002B7CF67D|nr:SMP-30/gluconolactonase/LRE family protein [Pseudorhodoplanes sp.]HWV50951.1 SMP-30/gluconolactonase/LRE family protein [Pseudorhodoplanes sp.]
MAESAAVQPLSNVKAAIGESPLWSPDDQSLYWVDIKNPRVLRYDFRLATLQTWTMPSEIGAICRADGGRFVVSLRNGVMKFDPATGELDPIVHPEAGRPAYRLNDSKVDCRGRLLVGSVEDPGFAPDGKLYSIAGASAAILQDRIAMPNALGWSWDWRTLYFADSFQRRIWTYEYDNETGVVGNRRVFAEIPEGEGFPDGLTVDEVGFVWNAQIDGWQIKRYDPDGRVERVVRLPVRRPTSLTFGGPDYRTIFITTGTMKLTDEELAAQPLSGCVLVLPSDVRGRPEPIFGVGTQ